MRNVMTILATASAFMVLAVPAFAQSASPSASATASLSASASAGPDEFPFYEDERCTFEEIEWVRQNPEACGIPSDATIADDGSWETPWHEFDGQMGGTLPNSPGGEGGTVWSAIPAHAASPPPEDNGKANDSGADGVADTPADVQYSSGSNASSGQSGSHINDNGRIEFGAGSASASAGSASEASASEAPEASVSSSDAQASLAAAPTGALPETGGASLVAIGAGALLIAGGLFANRLVRS